MKLKVGDIILDQYKRTIIAQNFETNSFGDISTRNGGFSNDFTIPLTSKNRLALDFPEDLNNTSRNPYSKVDAQLVDQGSVIAIGYLRYKIVNNDKEIRVGFFADNTQWFNLIKDKKMTDIDLSDYDHVWNRGVIASTIQLDKTEGFTYPLIDYGFFRDQDLATNDVIQSNQMFPSIFVHTIVEKLYKDIGWTVTGNLLTDNLYQRMIQPFSSEDFVHSKTNLDSRITNEVVTFVPTAPPVSTGDYPVIIEDGFYTVTANLDIAITGSSSNVTIKFKNNGVDFDNETFFITSGVTNTITINSNEVGLITSDQVTLEFSGSATTIQLISTSSLTMNPVVEMNVGDTVNMSATMPDMLQSDFLKYIFFSFGIVPQANNYSKEINLDFFNNVKDNIPIADDWSDKIDLSKRYSNDFTKLLNNYSRKSKMVYLEDDDDDELKAYKAETTQIFGEGVLDIDNDHLDPEKDIYESPYSSMINILSFDGSMYIPQIKYYQDDGTGIFIKEFQPKPKIAIISENIPVSDLTYAVVPSLFLKDPDIGTLSTISNISFTWFAKTQYIPSIDILDYTLAYDRVLFPNNIGLPLKETYIQSYGDVLNDMKYVKAYFKLNEVDLANLDFMKPVYVNKFKSYFYKNKISNYQGSNKTTECELIKIG